jgi:hypothetical protein
MPYTDFPTGLRTYTVNEVDQLVMGIVGALSSKNAMTYIILSTDWTLQSGGNQDGWYYADVIHGRTRAAIVRVDCLIGVDSYIHICAGINDVQAKQSTSTVRIWLQEEPQYDLFCLLVYA